MTLASQLVSDVSSVFLETDDFATSVTQYPLGVVANAVTLTAVFDQDDDNGQPGHDSMFGNRLMRQARLELAATVTVTCGETHRERDTFLIAGILWGAVRIIGRDSAMQTILVEYQDSPTGSPPS